tara:strand:+ start:1261 stop:1707 length:447 start_codon:yes stop_codon:yes gene_type:complete
MAALINPYVSNNGSGTIGGGAIGSSGNNEITIPLKGRQIGIIVFDSKKSIWEAKITNPFNGFGRGPMESLGCYKDEDAARRAITYFSTICIGDKGIRQDRHKVCEEQRLKVRIAALEIRLQNETAKNQDLQDHITILTMKYNELLDKM